MAIQSEVPGLIAITEDAQPDGSMRFVFEIDDERVDDFYAAFGLQPGDKAGFQRVLIEALNLLIERKDYA